MDTGQTVEKQSHSEGVTTSHYWVCSYPVVDTSLFLTSCLNGSGEVESEQVVLRLFDADGYLFNEVEYQFPSNRLGLLELESLMGGCKLESGFKHAHLELVSSTRVRSYLRIYNRAKAALLGTPLLLEADSSSFFPVVFAEDRAAFIAVVNVGKEESQLRCRLFCANRTPEMELTVPPYGVRLLSLEDEFVEFASLLEGKEVQAYVRLGAKAPGRLSVLLLEQVRTLKDKEFFCSIS